MPEEYRTYRFEPDGDPDVSLAVAEPNEKSAEKSAEKSPLEFLAVLFMFLCSISLYVGTFAMIAWVVASMLGIIG